MFKSTQRNFDRIEFADLRKKVDPQFNQLHDELSEAYYDYWKHGKSKPWRGYDVQATSQESKQLFDKLHGLIHNLQEIALDVENKKQIQPDQKLYDKYNQKKKKEKRTQISDTKYDVEIVKEDKTPIQQVQDKVNNLKAEGIELNL